MKILAFDSSGLVASVAIVENNNLIAEYTTNYKKTHSQTLLPMLEEIVKMRRTKRVLMRWLLLPDRDHLQDSE